MSSAMSAHVLALVWIFLSTGSSTLASNRIPERNFVIDYKNGEFLLDGKLFKYVSGSLHYSRLHERAWERRLQQFREMGLNAVQTYIPWNFHEEQPNSFKFSGNRNISSFIKTAQDSGLYTLLRIGPYICAEWENGGFPYFVTSGNSTLRTLDSTYIAYVKRYFDILLPIIKPHLYQNGGGVLMIQIENEYGFDKHCDKNYLKWLRDLVRQHLGPAAIQYTTDSNGFLECGTTQGVLPTIDFGPTDAEHVSQNADYLRTYLPGNKGPLVNSEYYTGWITKWKASEQDIRNDIPNDDLVIEGIKAMLQQNFSFNFYMAFGGTNFGYWNGAHSNMPVLTSYDYGAPIMEDGSERPLFYKIQAILKTANLRHHEAANTVPALMTGTFGGPIIQMHKVASVEDLLTVAKKQNKTCDFTTFEECGFPYGFMCYENKTSGKKVTVNGYLHADPKNNSFFCVENTGRINYPSVNSKWGVTAGDVTATYIIPDDLILDVARNGRKERKSAGAGLYIGYLAMQNFDGNSGTHIVLPGWEKGVLFVNGINIGRFWNAGPQFSLFVENYFLHKEENELIILDFNFNRNSCDMTNCYLLTSERPMWQYLPR